MSVPVTVVTVSEEILRVTVDCVSVANEDFVVMLVSAGAEVLLAFVLVGIIVVAVAAVKFVPAIVTFTSVTPVITDIVVVGVNVVIFVTVGVTVMTVGSVVAFSDVTTVVSSDTANVGIVVETAAVDPVTANK